MPKSYLVDCVSDEGYEHEYAAKKYIQDNFEIYDQKRAIRALNDLFREHYEDWFREDASVAWRWVETALKKKSPANWKTHGFGLLLNRNFRGSVFEEMSRAEAVNEIDLWDFYAESNLVDNIEEAELCRK